MYRNIGKQHGLLDEDVESRGMGQQGADLILSPAAREIFNHIIECKCHKHVVVSTRFEEHYEKYKDNEALKLLFSKNNRAEPLVTMRAEDFMKLLERFVALNTYQDTEEDG